MSNSASLVSGLIIVGLLAACLPKLLSPTDDYLNDQLQLVTTTTTTTIVTTTEVTTTTLDYEFSVVSTVSVEVFDDEKTENF